MITWWIWVIISVVVALGPSLAYLLLKIVRHEDARRELSREKSDGPVITRSHEHIGSYQIGEPSSEARLHIITDFWRIRTNTKRSPLDSLLDRAATDAIRAGRLMFNIPSKMVQGHKERVEVRIARSAAFHKELLSGLRGSGEPKIEEIDTSLYMEVKLAGPTFEVVCHSPAEQLIIPTPACWEFDVLPYRAGHRQLTLNVSMRIEAEGIVGGRRGVSVLEKQIDVEVNIRYATHRFVAGNWQWLIPTAVAVAGTVAAWLVVPF